MRLNHTAAIAFATLLASTACPEDGDPKLETDVDLDQPANELDDGEQTKLCEDIERWLVDVGYEELSLRSSCFLFSLQDAVDEAGGFDAATCNDAFTRCLNDPPAEIEQSDDELSCDFPPTCDATAAEYFDCFEEDLEKTRAIVNKLSCDDLDALAGLDGEIATVGPACQALYERCPELRSDGEDAEPGE